MSFAMETRKSPRLVGIDRKMRALTLAMHVFPQVVMPLRKTCVDFSIDVTALLALDNNVREISISLIETTQEVVKLMKSSHVANNTLTRMVSTTFAQVHGWNADQSDVHKVVDVLLFETEENIRSYIDLCELIDFNTDIKTAAKVARELTAQLQQAYLDDINVYDRASSLFPKRTDRLYDHVHHAYDTMSTKATNGGVMIVRKDSYLAFMNAKIDFANNWRTTIIRRYIAPLTVFRKNREIYKRRSTKLKGITPTKKELAAICAEYSSPRFNEPTPLPFAAPVLTLDL